MRSWDGLGADLDCVVDDLLAWERLGESWDEAVGKGTGGAAFDFFALVEVFEDFGCGG